MYFDSATIKAVSRQIDEVEDELMEMSIFDERFPALAEKWKNLTAKWGILIANAERDKMKYINYYKSKRL